MPHDKKNNLVKIGDLVIITGKVVSVSPDENYCNCTVECDTPMIPYTTPHNITLNTKQVEIIGSQGVGS